MYHKYIHEPKPLYIKDKIQRKSYKNTIYYLIGHVELLSEHENLTKVKNMYKPIIDEYYSIQDDTLEMPDEVYQIIIKSIDLLLEDIDRDTQRRVDRLIGILGLPAIIGCFYILEILNSNKNPIKSALFVFSTIICLIPTAMSITMDFKNNKSTRSIKMGNY